jgi:dTDP-glucose 4,6-dehydratase
MPWQTGRPTIGDTRARKELGWQPRETFKTGIEKTVCWYQNNAEWVARTRSGEYLEYYERMYGIR